MPQLSASQQQVRLAPNQFALPAATMTPKTPTTQPSIGPGNPTAIFPLIGQWLTGLFTTGANVFNAFGAFGGWFSNPIRILKMIVGIGLVLVGLLLLIMEPEIKALPGQAKTAVKAALMGA